MNKKIITEVGKINEHQSDPNTCVAEVTEEMAQEILRYAKMVDDNNLYMVQRFDYSIDYYDEMLDDYDGLSFEEIDAELANCEPIRAECNMLNVYVDNFRWEAIPKHFDDTGLFMSHRVPLAFLTNDEETLILKGCK